MTIRVNDTSNIRNSGGAVRVGGSAMAAVDRTLRDAPKTSDRLAAASPVNKELNGINVEYSSVA